MDLAKVTNLGKSLFFGMKDGVQVPILPRKTVEVDVTKEMIDRDKNGLIKMVIVKRPKVVEKNNKPKNLEENKEEEVKKEVSNKK